MGIIEKQATSEIILGREKFQARSVLTQLLEEGGQACEGSLGLVDLSVALLARFGKKW